MATTSPDNIWTPDSSDNYDYVIDAAATATSVQNALTKRANSYIGTSEDRIAFTADAPVGSTWADTNGDNILWIKQGASWQRVWPHRVPSAHLAESTSMITASPTAQAVPGTSITLDLSAGDLVHAVGVFDLNAASGIFLGYLLIDGARQPGEAHMESSARTTVSQVWQWTASSSGSHTVALSVAMLSGSATLHVMHTRLSIIVIPAS